MTWTGNQLRAHEARHRNQNVPIEFTMGYLHPIGHCPHDPPCSPATSKPYGGNEEGSRCLPQPKQAIAHASAADIVFYGGAVGGGKSEFAIVEAVILCMLYPGSKVAIFRRTLTQLEQELEGRIILLTWADDPTKRGPNGKLFCKYNRQRHKFTFWNGSELHLCFCNREADVYKYQSFQIIGLFIDESSHFTEFMVTYLMTRVRSARPGVPKVIRLTSNPGNVGHGWHKRWFIRPPSEVLGNRRLPQPFEIWRPLPRIGDPTPPERILTRQFIPAWFADNMALQAADPDYLGKVYALGGDKAKQLAEGDWDANESMICGSVWRERHLVRSTDTLLLATKLLRADQVIPWHVLPDHRWRPAPGTNIFGSVDYGFGAPWSFHLHAALPGGHTRTFFEFYAAGVRDLHQAQRIWKALNTETYRDGKTKLLEGLQWIVFDPAMSGSRAEDGLAKSIIEVYRDETQHKVQFIPGAGGRAARMSRPNRWLDALSTAADGFPHWSCTTACPDLIRTVPEVPWEEVDGHRGEVEDEDSENHCLAEGTLVLTRDGEQPIETIIAGDEVLTREGFQVVERAWQTSPAAAVFEVESSSGHRLRATGNHRIWTENRGFVRVDSLSYEDILLTDEEVRNTCLERKLLPWLSPQPSRNGEGNATTGAVPTLLGSAAPGRSRSASAASTGTFGRIRAARFREATTSTTATRTARTTAPATSNCGRTASTSDIMVGRSQPGSVPRAGAISAWRRLLGWLSRPPSPTVAPSATRPGLTSGPVSGSIAADAVGSARVTRVRPVAIVPVYDLTVAVAHEFIANGILVHNCYEDVGRFFEARPHVARQDAPDPLAHMNDDPISKAHVAARQKKESGAPKTFDITGLVR